MGIFKTKEKKSPAFKPLMALLCCLLSLITACKNNYTPENEEQDEDLIESTGTLMLQTSELFIEGEPNIDGEVTTRLHTNDENYWGLNGCTLWTAWGDEGIDDIFTERVVKMSKVKGDMTAGYGLVICHGERNVNGILVETMLMVMINNSGEYTIGKVRGGLYEVVEWWKGDKAILSGIGAPNEIKVYKDDESFVVEANGLEITRFVDMEAISTS